MMNDQQRARSVDAIRRAHAVMGSQTKLSFATGIAASRLSALINDQAIASATEAATIEKATGKQVKRCDIRPDLFDSAIGAKTVDPMILDMDRRAKFIAEDLMLSAKRAQTPKPEEPDLSTFGARHGAAIVDILTSPATRAPAPNPQPPAAKVTDGKARSRQEPEAEGRQGKAKERKGTGRSRGDR